METLNLAVACIEGRFDQPKSLVYGRFQNVFEKSAQDKISREDKTNFIIEFYSTDFDPCNLRVLLGLRSELIPTSEGDSIHAPLQNEKQMSVVHKSLIKEVIKLVQLILGLPATNAVSESSFSTLH